MKFRAGLARAWLALACAVGAAVADARAAEPAAARVIVLANSDDPGSLRVARHYAVARGVPEANFVALKLPLREEITWREFATLLWEPLLAQLVREKWIDAIPMALTDPVGRTKYATNGHRIAALVVCRGVPLKIAHDAALAGDAPPFTARAEFRTNAGAVDAELSLLPTPGYNINAFIANPLYQNDRPADAERHVVRVARLDGPTVEDALGLVDRALAAERTGLLGRAYVDLSDRDAIGNGWLESAAAQLRELAFDVAVDRAPATLPATARADAPALYFGWYAGNLDGPFALPGFRFPDGAIALHIHSYSAASLRTTTAGWTAPLVARGVTATVGNVNEPYLQFTHRPDLLLRALARGATWAEAAYFALPALSWQAILIGDPLYRPFAVGLEQQMRNMDALPPAGRGYALVRQVNALEAAKRADEARALAVRAQRERTRLAVGMALAERLRTAGDLDGAAGALGFAARLTALRTDEWALAAEAARQLAACGRPARAVEVWRLVLSVEALPRELQLAWLPEAEEAARAAHDAEIAGRWAARRAELAAAEKK